jgi:hypothetical protein
MRAVGVSKRGSLALAPEGAQRRRHMSNPAKAVGLDRIGVTKNCRSPSASQAAAAGLPTFFLSNEAQLHCPDLIKQGLARIVDIQNLNTEIARLPTARRNRAGT